VSFDEKDELLDRDWGSRWAELPEAPALVQRPKETQITLRLPNDLLSRVKSVARVKSLAYHSLARSWIAEGARSSQTPSPSNIESNDTQLNLKLDHDLLDKVKRRAAELRRPYHSLARDWIVAAVDREEMAIPFPRPAGRPGLGELILLLLDSPGSRGAESIHGITQLQKLLFVVEQQLGSPTHFYAHSYGPFDEAVYDAAAALQMAGFLRGGTHIRPGPPSFAEMVASVEKRAGPRASAPDVFALTDTGREAAERLRKSSAAYEALFKRIAEVRREWDKPDLVERVYATWPSYTEKSVIREEVESRLRRRNRE
jgi:predicted DNA binding CopG/RHH family protein